MITSRECVEVSTGRDQFIRQVTVRYNAAKGGPLASPLSRGLRDAFSNYAGILPICELNLSTCISRTVRRISTLQALFPQKNRSDQQ
jgi:hypothetical protein